MFVRDSEMLRPAGAPTTANIQNGSQHKAKFNVHV